LSDASGGADTAGSDAAEVLVICGPTAAGKTAIALSLAEREPAVIVSADSRQVYRGFDIGTAKPTAGELARVPHRGIDVAEPTTRYSAAVWAEQADRWIASAIAERRRPIVVGGTGLYLRALFEGLFEEPPLDAGQRRRLEPILGAMPLDELRRWTTQLDPERSHLGRTQLLRSIEIALLTGRRLSALHASHRERQRTPRWRPRYLVVDPGPVLADRIAARIDQMFVDGWPDEVRRLMQTIPADAPAWNATGYDAVRRFVRGEATIDETRERILVDTRQYAKRQRTWFRHQLPAHGVTRVNPLDDSWPRLVEMWSRTESRTA
jgi:tRNA dimethylallyltransferase